MRRRHCNPVLKIVAIVLLAGFILSTTAFGQEINLDKMKKAGDLICYPSLKDANIWYYLPDSPRLAMKNGKPQFSFMKYSRTNKTGKAGINAADGGGILHFLVTYGVSEDRVRAAEKILQEANPEAKIEGPIAYRKGRFALVTSFKEGNENWVRTVAVGKAPLMEGQKAAVSMALSSLGAQILWESFKTDTPDISLVFDMEFAGIREPYEATIEADWSRISKHKQLKAGFKYSWFGADVDMLFQELRQTGAIKITTKGTNASMDKIIQSANAKLLQVMFNPAPVDELTRAAAEKNSYSNLNQAMKLMKASGKSASRSRQIDLNTPGFRQMLMAVLDRMIPSVYAQDSGSGTRTITAQEKEQLKQIFNEGVAFKNAKKYEQAIEKFMECLRLHKEMTGGIPLAGGNTRYNIAICKMALGKYSEAAEYYNKAAAFYGTQTENGKRALEKARIASEKAGQQAAQKADTDSTSSPASASEAYNQARRLDNEAKKSGYAPRQTRAAIAAYEKYRSDYPSSGQRDKEIQGRIRSLGQRLASSSTAAQSGSTDSTASSSNSASGSGTASTPSTAQTSTTATTPSSSNSANTTTAPATTSSKPSTASRRSSSRKRKPTSAVKRAASKAPGFSLVASFRMKNIKRSGRMVYHMNHFRTEKQSFPMAENIGSLYSRYGNDSRIFRSLTIDDPVFKQREILVSLDGQDAATFTKYLNFVTVKMRKQHQSGAVTNDEIVITPELFNKSANSFSFIYGYKDDTDRDRWLNYQYQVIWSFHGGLEIRSPWKDENSPMLALAPPHRYRSVSIEGDGEELKQAGVRHAVVTVSSVINGKPITTQATIRNQGPAPSHHLDIPESADNANSTVAIKWFLKGSRQVESRPAALEGDIIYWDELP